MLAFRRYGLVLWFGLVFSLFTTAVMAQDQGWSAFKSRFLMPDGRIKHMLESGETRYDAEGRPLRSIATVQDITGIRQMEAQMRNKK